MQNEKDMYCTTVSSVTFSQLNVYERQMDASL